MMYKKAYILMIWAFFTSYAVLLYPLQSPMFWGTIGGRFLPTQNRPPI